MFVQSRLIKNVFKDLYSLKQILISTLTIVGFHIQISKLRLVILSWQVYKYSSNSRLNTTKGDSDQGQQLNYIYCNLPDSRMEAESLPAVWVSVSSGTLSNSGSKVWDFSAAMASSSWALGLEALSGPNSVSDNRKINYEHSCTSYVVKFMFMQSRLITNLFKDLCSLNRF